MSSFMCALATLNDNNIPIYKAENGVYLVQDTIAAHLFDTVEWKDLARIIFTEQLEVLDPHYALIWRSLLHWHRIWKKHADEVTTPFSKWAQVKVVRARIGPICQLKKHLEFLSLHLNHTNGVAYSLSGAEMWKFGSNSTATMKMLFANYLFRLLSKS